MQLFAGPHYTAGENKIKQKKLLEASAASKRAGKIAAAVTGPGGCQRLS
jgi:hypothetical protein